MTPQVKVVLARGRWCELAVAVALVGVWTIHTYIGPALAAIHWDRYLRASVADHALSRQLLSKFVSGEAVSAHAMRRKLSETMLDELRQAASWDPQSAAAHLRLADRLMSCFELEIVSAENVMDVTQIREAAFASPFASTLELNAWLQRAFGPAATYLDEALFHARRAVELCPLCGEGYLYLADLCFLEGAPRIAVRAYVDQGLAVRPYAKDVLFRAGRQELFLDPAAAIDHWSKCFNMPGPHQQEIVYRLIASHMPSAEFAAHFQPDWHSLREIWAQYRARGTAADLEALVEYAANVTTRQISDGRTIRPEHIWFWQAAMYRDLNRGAEALACLEQSHACDPRQFHVRSALARSLIEAERFAEAEPHVRWCLARKPTEKSLANALATISKQRFAGRANAPPQTAPTAISAAPVVQAAYQEHFAR